MGKIYIEDNFILNAIKNIGPSASCVYLYIHLKSNGKFIKFRLIEFIESLGFSKPIVIESIRILKKSNLIKLDIRIEEGRKSFYIKSLKTGKLSLPLYTSISSIYNISTSSIKDNIEYHDIFKTSLKKILSFRRFDNDYYRNKKIKLDEKARGHIKNFSEMIGKEDLDNYLNWWLEKKAYKISGLSMGLVFCVPMLEEYLINKGRFGKIIKKQIQQDRNMEMKKQMIKHIINKIDNNEKLGKRDELFLDDSIKQGLAKKEKDKVILIGD